MPKSSVTAVVMTDMETRDKSGASLVLIAQHVAVEARVTGRLLIE